MEVALQKSETSCRPSNSKQVVYDDRNRSTCPPRLYFTTTYLPHLFSHRNGHYCHEILDRACRYHVFKRVHISSRTCWASQERIILSSVSPSPREVMTFVLFFLVQQTTHVSPLRLSSTHIFLITLSYILFVPTLPDACGGSVFKFLQREGVQ
jgi:hypothetical protein